MLVRSPHQKVFFEENMRFLSQGAPVPGSKTTGIGGATKHIRQKEIDLPEEVCECTVLVYVANGKSLFKFSV